MIMLLFHSCERPEREGRASEKGIVGELYFQESQDRYYDLDSGNVAQFEKSVRKINAEKFSGRFKERVLMAKAVYGMGLQNYPSVTLITADDSLHTVILSAIDFEKFKAIDKLDLQRNGKKVIVTIEGEKVAPNVYRSNKVLQMETKSGLTLEAHKEFGVPASNQ